MNRMAIIETSVLKIPNRGNRSISKDAGKSQNAKATRNDTIQPVGPNNSLTSPRRAPR